MSGAVSWMTWPMPAHFVNKPQATCQVLMSVGAVNETRRKRGGVFLLEPGGFEQPFRLSQFVVFDAWTGSKQSQKGKDKFQFGNFFQYRCDQTRRTPGCFAEGIQGACHVSGLGDWGNSR